MSRRYGWLIASVVLGLWLAAPAVALADRSHTVQRGETLATIADQYGLSVAQLAQANNLVNPNLIYAGQVLHIPDRNTTIPQPSTTPAGGSHTVQRGETLSGIAMRYSVSLSALQTANGLSNPNLIYVGQVLRLPAGGAVVAPPAPAPAAKSVVVDKSEQRAYLYENGQLINAFVVSTGQPGSETWEGTWHVRSKIPTAYAYTWNLQMPYWLGFYHTGYLENGFHALPILPDGSILWDGYLGTPVSYGCVILSHPDAATLYQWAEIGTEVIVQP